MPVYPIDIVYEDGTTVSINDDEGLEEAWLMCEDDDEEDDEDDDDEEGKAGKKLISKQADSRIVKHLFLVNK